MVLRQANIILILFGCFASNLVSAQSLLDNINSDESSSVKTFYTDFSGFVRGVSYLGRTNDHSSAEFKSIYGDASFRVKSSFGGFGKAYVEARMYKGLEFGMDRQSIALREAWVSIIAGNFNMSLGQKIIVWGKADGINPTNNITPVNTLLRSPDPDDMRMGNFLTQLEYRFSPAIKLEGIWVPKYKPSLLPWQFAELPPGVNLKEGVYPDAKLENGSFAGKLYLDFPTIDASLSYFNGYGLNPGLNLGVPEYIPGDTLVIQNIITKAYRLQTVGFDFSTTIGKFGFRGEAAWMIPIDDYKTEIYVPNPDIWYVLGMDRSFGNFQLILQYIGRYVIDFEELKPPVDEMGQLIYGIEQGNRMFQMQQNEWSHSLSARASLNLFYETLNLEVFSLMHFTTDEYMVIPKITYSISDGLSIAAGMEWYSGVYNTLYNLIENPFNSVFLQLKAFF